jgi:predicted GNAT family acetyltransferase
MNTTYTLLNNEADKQYEFHTDSLVAKIEYIFVPTKSKIFLTHTEVPKALEGKGIASALVKQVLEDIEKRELTLVPMCPFVAAYIKRHPEWKKLVLKGIKIS